MPIFTEENTIMKHALLLSQTKHQEGNGELVLSLLKGDFTEADLAGYYVNHLNNMLTLIETVLRFNKGMTAERARCVLGTARGWPCRTCGSRTATKYCRCGFTHYCNSVCQSKDWKRHKKECGAIGQQFGVPHGRFLSYPNR